MCNCYFNKNNIINNIAPQYQFCDIDAKIIHYGGTLTNCKPWQIKFEKDDIRHPEQEYYLLLPEIYNLFEIWWKYAALLPANVFLKLKNEAERNRAIYLLFKEITVNQREIFINQLGLETLYVPSGWAMNNIDRNNDLNYFVKPKVYRCVDGKTKETIKNLPAEFTQKVGFRLVVKYIAANAEDNTAVLQILEPNADEATIYRRHGYRHGKNWSKWYKVATTDDICDIADKKVKELSCSVDKRFDNFVDDFESEKVSTQKAIDDLRKIVNKLQEEQAKLSSENHNLVIANKNLEANNRRLENNLTTAQSDLVSIRNSVSYKFGRTMTYIPRKIRDAFKTKK